MIVSLVGYMGSGKSHISKVLSEDLGFGLIDLDKEIVRENNLSVSEIFEKRGEIFFRKEEKRLLDEILATKENVILSLGGGTPAYYDNITNIKNHSTSIYLRAKIPTLCERLLKQKDKRPLIAKIPEEDLAEFIGKHLFEGNPFYTQCEFMVDTDDKTPQEIVAEIIHHLPLR